MSRLLWLLLVSGEALAGATPMAPPGTTPFQLLAQVGSGSGLTTGDFISSSAGLDAAYSYHVEVPPGTGQLVIQLFDADIQGIGSHDRIVPTFGLRPNLFINTLITYSIFDPTGSLRARFTCGRASVGLGPTLCPGFDDVWASFPVNAASPTGSTFAAPAAGHWEVRADTSSGVTGGDDINGYGVSAHDGTPGAGGTELNVYVDSFIPPGKQAAATSASPHAYHPYVTAGCTAAANEFDWDSSGSLTLTSFTGAYSSTVSDGALSGNAVWASHPLAGWTSAVRAADYGIWGLSAGLTAPPNFASIYIGGQGAPPPPPTGQPAARTFRIYLPTDAGGAPAKLQVGQEIIGPVSGPDPLQPEIPSVIRIAVGITNPAASAVAFSAPANVVTVAVPAGARTRYRGNATVTAGSIVSQPTLNAASGTVRWNPGTVGPGATAQLKYDLEVTPPAAGSLVVTGTPGAGGTVATYLDETANTAQARALYTFGPLCELSVSAGDVIATLAQVTALEAWADPGGGATVEWHTLSEHGTVGFHLLRHDDATGRWDRVNRRLLPALLHSRLGATYRLSDPAAVPGEFISYKLLEREATGNLLEHGPFEVVVADTGPPPLKGGAQRPAPGFKRVARVADATVGDLVVARRAARAQALETRRSQRGPRLKILVREAGLYRLEAADTAPLLGIAPAEFATLAHNGRLALSNLGRRIATRTVPGADGLAAIEFVAEAIDSQYTDHNVYWLERGQGLLMRERAAGQAAFAPGLFFEHTARAEGNRYAITHLFDDPNGDYWMWDFRFGGMDLLPECIGNEPECNLHYFPVTTPGIAADAPTEPLARLRVRLHGATRTSAPVDHRVTVKLNGVTLGETAWSDLLPHEAVFELAPTLLDEAGNWLEIEAADSGLPDEPSVVYVNDLEITYPRAYRAERGVLKATASGHRSVTVSGFASDAVSVFDLTNPRRPRVLRGAVVTATSDGYAVSFRPRAGAFLAAASGSARPPAAVFADAPSRLVRRGHRVDYLIITTADLAATAEVLAAHRRSARGLRSLVVDVEDIYDEFSHGVTDAEAIWHFLHYAHARWRVAPRYVLLAGEGSIDYKNRLGYGDALVPTLLTPTPNGLFPSDNLFADVAGNDWEPEFLIGRLPVINAAELAALTDKLITYEASLEPAWARSAVLVADAPDAGGAFPADSDALATLFPADYAVDRIYLDEISQPLASIQLVEALEAGRAYTNFVGHGGLVALGKTGLLGSADVDGLSLDAPPTVLTAQTCLVGQFSLPGVETIGEKLVLRPHGGAIALWGPSGLSFNDRARVLGQGFYNGVFEQGEWVIGEAILAAQRSYAAGGEDMYLLDIYNLLGDPALLMK